MIQSIHKGRGFRGVLNYVMNPEKSPELVAGNMYGTDPRTLATEFKQWRELRPGLGRAVFHSSLSLPHGPGGREELGDAQWREVAERYLEHLGYGRSPFVVVRHRDTEHDHVHIVAARIDAEGRTVSDSNDYRRGEEVLRQLERDFGLTPVRSAHEAERSAMRPGEIRELERAGSVSARLRLQDLLDRATADRPSVSELLRRLQDAGVEVVPRVAKTGHVSGISYRLDEVAFRGSALGRRYSWRGLQDRLGVSYEPERDLSAIREAAARAVPEKGPARTSPWSLPSLDALRSELQGIGRKIGIAASAKRGLESLARSGSEALAGPASAARLAYSMRSRRSAARSLAARVPGAAGVVHLMDISRAARSPLGLLLYGARIATSAGRLALASPTQRSSAATRQLVAGFARAAAADRPAMPAFLNRLRSAGVEPLPLLDGRGTVRAVAYWVGGELVSGQELGPAFTWTGLQQRLGVSYEPARDLPRIREGRERTGVGPPDRDDRGGAYRSAAADARRRNREAPGVGRSPGESTAGRSGAVEPGSAQQGSRGKGRAPHLGPRGEPRDRAPAERPATRLGPSAGATERPGAGPTHAPTPRQHGGARALEGAGLPLGSNFAVGHERLSRAALRAALERTGTPPLASFHARRIYAGNLERADTAWATAALRAGVQPHLVLREVAARGARATAAPEARLAHGTRVVARALATIKPARTVEKAVTLAAQALAVVIKAPLAVVKALLIIRSIARELSQERGR